MILKPRSIFQYLASLAIVSSGYLLPPNQAVAEPAATFQPILEEIRDRLPEGMVMRLPSEIEVLGVNGVIPLYGTIISNNSSAFSIGLVSQPDCQARFCQIGSLSVHTHNASNRSLEFIQSQISSGSPITLKEGITGTYIYVDLQGASGGIHNTIIWEQDGLTYVVSLPSLDRERDKENIINIAKSMANELPITSQARTPITWQEFVAQRSEINPSIPYDFDLPDELRNGRVYFVRGVTAQTAYIFKRGLASYPPISTSLSFRDIDDRTAENAVRSGEAIKLFFGLGFTSLEALDNTDVQFTNPGMGCFRRACLTAPWMIDDEIRKILMSRRPIGESFVLHDRGRLETGDSVMSSDGSLVDRYSFEGQQGQPVKIDVASQEFDTYLLLIDPDRNKIAENDDRFSSVTSSYLEVTLPKTGTYTVVVNGYDRNSRGNYLLTITTPDR